MHALRQEAKIDQAFDEIVFECRVGIALDLVDDGDEACRLPASLISQRLTLRTRTSQPSRSRIE